MEARQASRPTHQLPSWAQSLCVTPAYFLRRTERIQPVWIYHGGTLIDVGEVAVIDYADGPVYWLSLLGKCLIDAPDFVEDLSRMEWSVYLSASIEDEYLYWLSMAVTTFDRGDQYALQSWLRGMRDPTLDDMEGLRDRLLRVIPLTLRQFVDQRFDERASSAERLVNVLYLLRRFAG